MEAKKSKYNWLSTFHNLAIIASVIGFFSLFILIFGRNPEQDLNEMAVIEFTSVSLCCLTYILLYTIFTIESKKRRGEMLRYESLDDLEEERKESWTKFLEFEKFAYEKIAKKNGFDSNTLVEEFIQSRPDLYPEEKITNDGN